MRLFGLFGKGSKEQPKENEQNTEENSHAEITAGRPCIALLIL